MTKPEVWDRLMSDADFVELSLPFFKKKYWNLHEGCCLLAKVNPFAHPGVGVGFEQWTEDDFDSEDDYTRRPFQVALRSILAGSEADLFEFERPKLNAHRLDYPILDGKSVLLDVTVFVGWVLKRWPDQARHFELAWDQRQKRKASSKGGQLSSVNQSTSMLKNDRRREAFVQMCKEMGAEFDKMSDRELAIRLSDRIKSEKFSARPETLRKSIAKWRADAFG